MAPTCPRCRQEEMLHGIAPSCEGCAVPRLRLLPGNRRTWEIYRIMARLGEDFHVDVIRLMEKVGVGNPLRELNRLGLIRVVALENTQRVDRLLQE